MSTLSVRIPESFHRELRALARHEGISINQLIASAVGEKLASLKTVDYLRERAARASRVRFESGGGLVLIHGADNAFPNWPAFNEMMGVGGWGGRTEQSGPLWYFKDGKLVSDETPGRAGAHGARLPFLVTTRESGHPMMKGLPKAWMHHADELYTNLRGPGRNMTVLATAYSDPRNRGTGRDEPMLMVLSFGRGRIVHHPMGHDVSAMSSVDFGVLLQRGTEWAATGAVTQNVPAGYPTATTVNYRADLLAMDPAYWGPPPSK